MLAISIIILFSSSISVRSLRHLNNIKFKNLNLKRNLQSHNELSSINNVISN